MTGRASGTMACVVALAWTGGCGGKAEQDGGHGCADCRLAASVSAGKQHTCAVTRAGGVKCWGANNHGQLGDGTETQSSTPVDVLDVADAVGVATGDSYSCALTSSGGFRCWGGSMGLAESPPQRVRAFDAGAQHLCIATELGAVFCWGSNTHGQLGDGSQGSVEHEWIQPVGLGSGVVAVSAGYFHTCALSEKGSVKCWGYGGRVGDGTDITRTMPTNVLTLSSGVIAVSAGAFHTCALLTDGGVKCWGFNGFGVLGDGTEIDRTAPVSVAGLSGKVVAVAAGGLHTCALTDFGAVQCWGDNSWGALGDGTLNTKFTPIPVSNLDGVQSISAGYGHSCAVTTAGHVKCWGLNPVGQIGDGTSGLPGKTTPTAVVGF